MGPLLSGASLNLAHPQKRLDLRSALHLKLVIRLAPASMVLTAPEQRFFKLVGLYDPMFALFFFF